MDGCLASDIKDLSAAATAVGVCRSANVSVNCVHCTAAVSPRAFTLYQDVASSWDLGWGEIWLEPFVTCVNLGPLRNKHREEISCVKDFLGGTFLRENGKRAFGCWDSYILVQLQCLWREEEGAERLGKKMFRWWHNSKKGLARLMGILKSWWPFRTAPPPCRGTPTKLSHWLASVNLVMDSWTQ